jgi:UDP-N-acetylmuramoyl-L-alanyl-D-glutamate--2,6-diaminopimelate ligase
MAKRFLELLEALPDGMVIGVVGDGAIEITAPVVESTQDLEAGGVFVARKGLSTDGHDYIAQAIERGAAAIVGEHDLTALPISYAQVTDSQWATGLLSAAYHDFPSRKLIVIGVTGTDGKTTTSTLLHSILKVATDGKAGYVSTLAADLGGTTSDTGLHVTTPGAPQLQAYLAQMVENGIAYCVLEMTSHGLAQGRLNGVDIDVAVMTNVTHEHLDYHGTFENYRAAKAIMFRMLSYSRRKRDFYDDPVQKTSVINKDDPNADYFRAIPADRKMTYGIDESAEIYAESIDYSPERTLIEIEIGGDLQVIETTLVGQFNVSNILAAAAATYALGMDVEDIRQGIADVRAISGRMERIDEGQDFTAIVDFAHTPNALKNALEACRVMLPSDGRLIAVFGSAGLRDVEKRRLMAETSARLADFTILTAEDPRTESLDAILEMMAEGCVSQGGVEGETFIRVRDRGEALYQACRLAEASDIVIACGKGHEQSMCFGAVEHPWDDRVAMRAALQGRPLRTLPTATE